MYCKNCGEQIKDGQSFCMNCGQACEKNESIAAQTSVAPVLDQTPVSPEIVPSAPVYNQPVIQSNNKNSNKLMYVIIAVIVLVAVIAIVAVLLVTNNKKESSSKSSLPNTNSNTSNIISNSNSNSNSNSSWNDSNSNDNDNYAFPKEEEINGSTTFGDYTITIPSNYEANVTRWEYLGDIIEISNPTTGVNYEIMFTEKTYDYYKSHEEETKNDLTLGVSTIAGIQYKNYDGKEYMVFSEKYKDIYTMIAFVAINNQDTVQIQVSNYYDENYDIFSDISSIISSIK